jgi:glycosyltransferase involved in cell wall biosynthesis
VASEQGNYTGGHIRVLAWIEALSITGPAKNLLEFARLARASGKPVIEITLATFRRPLHPPVDVFLQAAEASGIPCEVIEESGPADWRILGRMRALAKRLDVDVLQTHSAKSHFLMRLSGLPRTLPWVAFHHGYTWPTRKQQLYNHFDRWSLRKAKRVITVTEAFRRELEQFGVSAERTVIIPNSVPADWMSATDGTHLRKELLDGEVPGTKLVLAVGRLSKEKAHTDLVEAVSQVENRGIPVRLVVVGQREQISSKERGSSAPKLCSPGK